MDELNHLLLYMCAAGRKGSRHTPQSQFATSPIWDNRARQDLDKRRFARAINPEECRDLAGEEIEVYSTKRACLSVGLHDVMHRQDRPSLQHITSTLMAAVYRPSPTYLLSIYCDNMNGLLIFFLL